MMISRLTASAALFAVLSAATITFAAGSGAHREDAALHAARAPVHPLVTMPRVEITGRRAALARR